MEIQPKDTSRGHFYVSIAKSVVRVFAGGCLMLSDNPMIISAGILLTIAETLGIIEELV